MICEIICVTGFLCMSHLDIVHISSVCCLTKLPAYCNFDLKGIFNASVGRDQRVN